MKDVIFVCALNSIKPDHDDLVSDLCDPFFSSDKTAHTAAENSPIESPKVERTETDAVQKCIKFQQPE
jgi:hypothetical protein